jgi:hypothetical protein
LITVAERRVSRDHAQADNRLAFMDQASFLGLRATGLGQLAQWTWVYPRAVDLDGLQRFHDNLGHGLLGRRIERSPLPFGRHRWVSCPQGPGIDIAVHPRPRAEVGDWADERAQLPIDPEWGPGWHLGVARFTDGSTAVSLVASHSLVDGLGSAQTIADAVKGDLPDLGYPPPRSRTRLRAVLADARQTFQGAPEVGRALAAVVKLARSQQAKRPASTVETKSDGDGDGDGDHEVIAPAITIQVGVDQWDARAKDLGGTSNSLFTAFAAKLGEHMGRQTTEDGPVGVRFAVSDRTAGDTRANALSFTSIDVDPTTATKNLSGVRAATKAALIALRETPDESLQALPLTPLTPKPVARRLADMMFDELSVGCSNLGDIDPLVGRPDGTDADSLGVRGVTQHMTRQVFEKIHGQLTMASGRFGDNVFMTVIAYRLKGRNSKTDLRELAARTLAEFDLTGEMD